MRVKYSDTKTGAFGKGFASHIGFDYEEKRPFCCKMSEMLNGFGTLILNNKVLLRDPYFLLYIGPRVLHCESSMILNDIVHECLNGVIIEIILRKV